jgi:hypothetical protein
MGAGIAMIVPSPRWRNQDFDGAARSCCRSILPVPVFGKSDQYSIERGYL